MNKSIKIEGARVHNLKNLNLSLPKNKLVVITGISGSGKSSLAFDTIFAEGQRRYMESFSAYARQFMGDLERPDVDSIRGLSPVISIEQKTTNRNPRSTVGTVTEVYDFLRLLFARIAEAYSYNTGKKMDQFSENEIVEYINTKFKNKKVILLAPIVKGRKGHYRELFEQFRKQGYLRVRVDGEIIELKEKMQLDRYVIHDIELVIDRLIINEEHNSRLYESIHKGLELGKGLIYILDIDKNNLKQFSQQLMCIETGISYETPSPNSFSFNSPYGYCTSCKGLGTTNAVNLNAIIPDDNLSIQNGAIKPIGEDKDSWSYKALNTILKKHKIPTNKPFNELSLAHKNLIFYGNAAGEIGKALADQAEYEGIVNQLMRWYSESNSDAMRSWIEQYMNSESCNSCNGARLKKESLWFKINDKNISELSLLPLNDLSDWFANIDIHLNKKQTIIAKDVLKEIKDRLNFLIEVGLSYLSLNRASKTLSGGESQRIRLATQIGSQLTGITYILDEPSIGLHQRDNDKLINALKKLRDNHNSLIVVEHDKDIMLAADYLIDIGPKAGIHGGDIVSQGTPEEILKSGSTTASYLNGSLKIQIPEVRRKGNGNLIKLKGATGNNLKNVNIEIPLGCLVAISGVSGSGKSTLINQTLYPILAKHCYPIYKQTPMPYKAIEGIEEIDKVIEIDQTPIGRTPRSNPATYCGFFNDIRQLFAQVPESKIRGYTAGRFSFNVKGGRCETCQGGGMKTIEMNFLPDVYVACEQCNGKRYNRETLEIRFKGKSIADILEMTIGEAVEFFIQIPSLYRKVKTLDEVGLGYIKLGQSAVTLSGGEAQRVKLATELAKKDTGRTVYLLDEPTTGLHFQDINQLLKVLNKLVDRGNTMIVIEHNLDIIKVADYVIDIGLEGGAGGGTVVECGTPEKIAKNKKSHTGKYLKAEL
jgi:excinuclease ABC subunit A